MLVNYDTNEGVICAEKSNRKVYPVHWLLSNISFNVEEIGIPYYPPESSSKIRRYAFFLFKQKVKVNILKEFLVITRDSDPRYYFDLLFLFDSSKNFNLVGANYFFLGNDDICMHEDTMSEDEFAEQSLYPINEEENDDFF
jgi:hypothetical protein